MNVALLIDTFRFVQPLKKPTEGAGLDGLVVCSGDDLAAFPAREGNGLMTELDSVEEQERGGELLELLTSLRKESSFAFTSSSSCLATASAVFECTNSSSRESSGTVAW